MNATERKPTVNDAKTGDYVTLAGARWQVIGYHDRMTALLAKEGCEQMPVGQRTHHSVCLGSMESRDCLLSPTDQGEAGTQQPDWTPCERTVRHVADMVEAWSRNGLSAETNFILAAAAADIRRTLPKHAEAGDGR